MMIASDFRHIDTASHFTGADALRQTPFRLRDSDVEMRDRVGLNKVAHGAGILLRFRFNMAKKKEQDRVDDFAQSDMICTAACGDR